MFGLAVAEEAPSDKNEAFRRIVQNYIQAGKEEYDKGSFKQAEKTFLMAQEYQKYLTATEKEQLNELLKKAQNALLKKPQKQKMTMKELEQLLQTLLEKPALQFRDMKPTDLPKTAVVYLITVKDEVYYVGCTKNFRQQIHTNHLLEPLQKYLIDAGECRDNEEAKQFFREQASVRWLEVVEFRPRAFLECFATAILQPKYVISEEH